MEDKKFHKVQSFDTLHNFIADPKQKYKSKVKRAINRLYAANLYLPGHSLIKTLTDFR